MGANKQSVEKVMESMRHFFSQRPNSVLLGTFRAQDSDGSGSFELPEFKRALKSLNMDISEADMEAVFNSLDTDGEGTLALKEFLNELKAEPDPREAQWLRFGIGHQYVQPNREPPSVEALSGDSGFQPMVPWAAKGYHTNEGYYESYTGGGGCTADGLIRKCSMLRLRGDGARPLLALPSCLPCT